MDSGPPRPRRVTGALQGHRQVFDAGTLVRLGMWAVEAGTDRSLSQFAAYIHRGCAEKPLVIIRKLSLQIKLCTAHTTSLVDLSTGCLI